MMDKLHHRSGNLLENLQNKLFINVYVNILGSRDTELCSRKLPSRDFREFMRIFDMTRACKMNVARSFLLGFIDFLLPAKSLRET